MEEKKETTPGRDINTEPWEQIGDQCLALALDLLKKETAPTAATVGTVKGLIEAAEIAARCLEAETSAVPWSTDLLG